METFGQYILSVISAAILLGILMEIPGKNSTFSALLRLVGGVFLMLAMIAPVSGLDFSDIGGFFEDYSVDGEAAAASGAEDAEEALRSIIKSRAEAYILDKAVQLQVRLEYEITLSDEESPVPVSVRLKGDVSPYAKAALGRILEADLGIAKENQLWIG